MTYQPPAHLPEVIVFTRHPECEHNVNPNRALKNGIPNRNSPITEFGAGQAMATAQYLKNQFGTFDAVFCSQYFRTHVIPNYASYGHQLRVCAGLNERNMGVWHTMPRETVLEKYPGEEERLQEVGYFHYCAPEGESCLDVEEQKLKPLLADASLYRKTHQIYFSGHDISGLSIRRLLTGATIADWWGWFYSERMGNASVTVFRRQGVYYTCEAYNVLPWKDERLSGSPAPSTVEA